MKTLLFRDQILQMLTDHKGPLKEYGVTEIGLFGSYARNEDIEKSDIDLLVNIQKEKKP